MTTHSILPPSGAERWMNCAASVAMEEGLYSPDTKYSAEGSAAHHLAAVMLKYNKPATFFRGDPIKIGEFTFKVDDEMIRHIQGYVDRLNEYAKGNQLVFEQSVDFSAYVGVPDQRGTSDGIILTTDEEIQVHDLKYGMGNKV
jgi:hypothetical protein